MRLLNYLFFRSGCAEALAFYEACGLGRVVELHARAAAGAAPSPGGQVMHARFEGPGLAFCASDNDDAEPMRGSAHLLLVDEAERTATLFAALAIGGSVTTPLGRQPWSLLYGKVTDRFGVQWMVNFDGGADEDQPRS